MVGYNSAWHAFLAKMQIFKRLLLLYFLEESTQHIIAGIYNTCIIKISTRHIIAKEQPMIQMLQTKLY